MKVSLGIGAWTGADYSIVMANPAYRATLMNDIKKIVSAYHYDGVDIDWEYPNGPIDLKNFDIFMSELRAAFPSPSFLISLDVPNYPSSGIDFPHLIKLVNWFNVMMYDAAGPWVGNVEMNSPIFDDPANPNDQGAVNQAADDFLSLYNVPAKMINMGTPFYGYDYMDQKDLFQVCNPCADDRVPSLNYAPDIKSRINKKGWIRKYDPVEAVPYLVKADGSNGFITYDDFNSTFHRVYYSLWQRDLGGTFMWSLDADFDGHSQDCLEGMYLATVAADWTH